MQKLTILGSTGSIGKNVLEVVKSNSQHFSIKALVAYHNVKVMTEQCIVHHPTYAAMINRDAANKLRIILSENNLRTKVLSGEQSACELAELSDVNQVISAIVGTSGLLPTLSAIRSGKRILLANKEALIICGRLFMEEVKKSHAQLIPLDSEHNAIFQSLPESIQCRLGYASLSDYGILGFILTGSGGPFYVTPINQFKKIVPNQACIHPNWSMGRKISVDSATMMNKGLEYIEARWLFNASFNEIEVILHPQSIIHSMVRYTDGSILAQLGVPDMRTSISYGMAYPKRINSGVKQLDFCQIKSLTFSKPDRQRYPCFYLAMEACNAGQAATIILNAANEIAVSAFLDEKICFTDIASITQTALERLSFPEPSCIDEILDIDRQARNVAKKIVRLI
ncbi:1-deoxy-D-xylulose 5-phosphate reductoisomerase [Candidatus Ecksteinia adelgidicola]|nr:1-deoxy-D-xylulose 5-phosphate reductoisomerase [Candidatus Ecksteinia adelgidicola]